MSEKGKAGRVYRVSRKGLLYLEAVDRFLKDLEKIEREEGGGK